MPNLKFGGWTPFTWIVKAPFYKVKSRIWVSLRSFHMDSPWFFRVSCFYKVPNIWCQNQRSLGVCLSWVTAPEASESSLPTALSSLPSGVHQAWATVLWAHGPLGQPGCSGFITVTTDKTPFLWNVYPKATKHAAAKIPAEIRGSLNWYKCAKKEFPRHNSRSFQKYCRCH